MKICKKIKTYNCEFLLIGGGALERIERRVVSNLSFPLAVEVICHDVDHVQVLGDFRYIISAHKYNFLIIKIVPSVFYN